MFFFSVLQVFTNYCISTILNDSAVLLTCQYIVLCHDILLKVPINPTITLSDELDLNGEVGMIVVSLQLQRQLGSPPSSSWTATGGIGTRRRRKESL